LAQLNSIPNFNVPLSTNGITGKDWYFFWAGLYSGLPPALPMLVTLTASPFTYSPSAKGTIFVSGGTVSLIQFSRDGVTSYPTGTTAGPFVVNANDRLIITYTVAPTVTFVPT